MKNIRIWFLIVLIEVFFGTKLINAECMFCFEVETGCTQALTYAMDKQKKDLKERLEDLKDTIEANTKQTKHQTKIIEQEVLAYRRLLERLKKETLSLKEAAFLSKKIRDSESLGLNLDIIKKGK